MLPPVGGPTFPFCLLAGHYFLQLVALHSHAACCRAFLSSRRTYVPHSACWWAITSSIGGAVSYSACWRATASSNRGYVLFYLLAGHCSQPGGICTDHFGFIIIGGPLTAGWTFADKNPCPRRRACWLSNATLAAQGVAEGHVCSALDSFVSVNYLSLLAGRCSPLSQKMTRHCMPWKGSVLLGANGTTPPACWGWIGRRGPPFAVGGGGGILFCGVAPAHFPYWFAFCCSCCAL